MKLASIERITNISEHSNATALEFAHVLGYKSIIRKEDQFKIGEQVVFIYPDSVLPDTEWSKFFKAKSSRVKAIKLRGEWSEGIVLHLNTVGISTDLADNTEVSELLNITKYEAPEPQDLQAKGYLPFDIPVTDEENYQTINNLPYGELVDVTLKRDGKSWTAYAVKRDDQWYTGICGRRLEFKLDSSNDYTKFKYVLEPLLDFAKSTNKSIVIRGEITGEGIQASKNNPHSTGEKKLSIFSVYLPDTRCYATKTSSDYYINVAKALNLNTVEILETQVILTKELIKKYAEDLTQVNGKPFEGVVIKGNNFSFKVINKDYDSKK